MRTNAEKEMCTCVKITKYANTICELDGRRQIPVRLREVT